MWKLTQTPRRPLDDRYPILTPVPARVTPSRHQHRFRIYFTLVECCEIIEDYLTQAGIIFDLYHFSNEPTIINFCLLWKSIAASIDASQANFPSAERASRNMNSWFQVFDAPFLRINSDDLKKINCDEDAFKACMLPLAWFIKNRLTLILSQLRHSTKRPIKIDIKSESDLDIEPVISQIYIENNNISFNNQQMIELLRKFRIENGINENDLVKRIDVILSDEVQQLQIESCSIDKEQYKLLTNIGNVEEFISSMQSKMANEMKQIDMKINSLRELFNDQMFQYRKQTIMVRSALFECRILTLKNKSIGTALEPVYDEYHRKYKQLIDVHLNHPENEEQAKAEFYQYHQLAMEKLDEEFEKLKEIDQLENENRMTNLDSNGPSKPKLKTNTLDRSETVEDLEREIKNLTAWIRRHVRKNNMKHYKNVNVRRQLDELGIKFRNSK